MTSSLGRLLVGSGLAAALSMLAACDEPCHFVRQTVVIDAPDSELQPLIEACRNHVAEAGETCSGSWSNKGDGAGSVECGCLPLCRATLQIIDQFPGAETLDSCRFSPPPTSGFDAGSSQQGGSKVIVRYRPGSCP